MGLLLAPRLGRDIVVIWSSFLLWESSQRGTTEPLQEAWKPTLAAGLLEVALCPVPSYVAVSPTHVRYC